MDTISFILGISSVVVIAIAVVSVVGFFKVISVAKHFNNYRQYLDVELSNKTKEIRDEITQGIEYLHRRIDSTEREYSTQNDELRRNIDQKNHEITSHVDLISQHGENNKNEIYRYIDSRFDKFENKLNDTIKNGCEPVKESTSRKA